jgi:Spy/CpxP family protein refolding chaperone
MRPQVKWLLTATLAGLIVSPVVGQAPREVLQAIFENGVDAPMLLANPGVQKEIKLSDKQHAQVKKVVQEVFDKYKPEFQKAGRDQAKRLKLMADSTQETRDRLRNELPDILKPEQLKRLKEIQIQVNGIVSFKREDVQKELNLTDEQKEKIKGIGEGLKKDVAALFKDAASAPLRKMPEAMRKSKELKDAATRKAVETLTEEQQKSWQKMHGEKFDLKLDLGLRGGGRG